MKASQVLYVIFLFLALNLKAQNSNLEKWLKNEKVDSIFTFLVQKKKNSLLSNREYSLLIYSAMIKQQNKNALAFCFEWENLSNQKLDTNSVVKSKNYRAKIYALINEYQNAIDLTKELITFYKGQRNYNKVYQNQLVLGYNYNEVGEYMKAINIYNQIPIDSLNNKSDLSAYYTNYSNIQDNLGNYKKALKYALKNVEIVKQDSPEEIPLDYNNIASILIDLKQYKEALSYLDSAGSSISIGHVDRYKKLIYQNKFTAYSILKNTDSAFFYLEKLRILEQDKTNNKLNTEIESLKLAFEKEKELQQVLKQTQIYLDKSRQREIWVIGLTLLFIFVSIAVILFLKLKNTQTQNENIELEFSLLRSQINPHFIFNTLASIQSLIRQEKNKESIQYLNKFAKLMRQILDSSRGSENTLAQEIELLKKYVELQQLRKNNFDFKILINNEAKEVLEEINIPSLILQPFIENSINHGINNLTHKGYVSLSVNLQGGKLVLEIEDNGVGLQSDLNKKVYKSHAINITKERLKILDKQKKTKSTLKIQNKISERGVLVTIKIEEKN